MAHRPDFHTEEGTQVVVVEGKRAVGVMVEKEKGGKRVDNLGLERLGETY